MDILYLLIPLSALLVLAIVGLFGWAVQAGQFDDLEREGGRFLQPECAVLDEGQPVAEHRHQQSTSVESEAIAGGT